MKTLLELYNKHKKGDWPDKNSTHSYLPVYEEILAPYRHTARNILEIGLMSGESLRMWDEYFSGKVYGMDCDIKPIDGKADLTYAVIEGYNVVIGDAANVSDVAKHFKGIKFDVVIEDANHDIDQQLQIYKTLKPYMAKGGLYCIEDIQNLDETDSVLENIDSEKPIIIYDRRQVKKRYDDVIVAIHF